jgi:hypothetical protein
MLVSSHKLLRGQLILKCLFGVFKSTKKTMIFLKNFCHPLASKKRFNQKNKGTFREQKALQLFHLNIFCLNTIL